MASPVYLLDTNVVLQLLRGKALGKHLASTFGLLDTVNRPVVSIVTHGELLVMADRRSWGEKKREALQNAPRSLVGQGHALYSDRRCHPPHHGRRFQTLEDARLARAIRGSHALP